MKTANHHGRYNRPKLFSISNIIYAVLSLIALVLFMHDAQALSFCLNC